MSGGLVHEQYAASASRKPLPIPMLMGDQFDVRIQADTSPFLFALTTPTTFVFESMNAAMAFHRRFGDELGVIRGHLSEKAVAEMMPLDDALRKRVSEVRAELEREHPGAWAMGFFRDFDRPAGTSLEASPESPVEVKPYLTFRNVPIEASPDDRRPAAARTFDEVRTELAAESLTPDTFPVGLGATIAMKVDSVSYGGVPLRGVNSIDVVDEAKPVESWRDRQIREGRML
jgi:hypothetical protein